MRPMRTVIAAYLAAALLANVLSVSRPAWAQTAANGTAVEDLSGLSLQQLADVEVTSVTKTPETLHQAPAAIYVITHEEIMRSGVTTLSEALRLAPNLTLYQLSASNYSASARGFGPNIADQSFSNKLLILIDGRSVYTPLFSGVYLDAQDVVMEDIDRIEVISGPGSTLWGANAMNGVINIITRASYLSQGALLSGAAGNQEQELSARYGGKVDESLAYRVYGKDFQIDALQRPDGSSAHDAWTKGQGGFRADWTSTADSVTVQGDLYRGTEQQPDNGDTLLAGANVLGRWIHRTERSALQLQAYYDQTERSAPTGGDAFVLHTYDVELQDTLALGSVNHLVMGAGERINSYGITNSAQLLFIPPKRALTLANVFAQDTLALTGAVNLIVGVKLEDDPYWGWAVLPDVRLAWDLSDRSLLWAAASKSIRSPTPFDVDVQEKVGSVLFLRGNPSFQPERLTAYELGYRAQPGASVSLSATAFYNAYTDVRSVEFAPPPPPLSLPLQWDNELEGHTYGIEAWAEWQVLTWWRVSPGVRTLHKDLRFTPGASGLLGPGISGDDPDAQVSLKSSMDLPFKLTFDVQGRYVSALPAPALPPYYELDARIGWRLMRTLELSLSGFNLLQARHEEYPAPDGESIPRSVLVGVRWTP